MQVRTHPVTKLKALNYNPTFIERIEELHEFESKYLLSFLREHLLNADDLSVRWKWTAGSVAFWDNRIIAHKAIPGGYDVSLREGKRTAVHGERPFFDPSSESLSERASRLEREDQSKATATTGTENATAAATVVAETAPVTPAQA